MAEKANFWIATKYGKFLRYLLYYLLAFLAAPREVQVGHSETVFHPECGAVLEQVSRELGDPGGFQDPAIQSHGCPYLLSAAVPLQGESWARHHQRFSLPILMIL